MTRNRARIARENAGLSLGQAAKLLKLASFELQGIETYDSAFYDHDARHLADLYHVNVEWLCGITPQHDYSAVDGVKGAEGISSHDRDIIAEFAASMPRRKA